MSAATPGAVHLHVHSEYSLLDGACKLSSRKKDKDGKPVGRMSLAERAAELEMPALGLTDHGVMNGAVEHYKACREHGIKPILGMEAYLVDDRNAVAAQPRYERNHLTLLAQSDEGFRNLVKLSSAGFLEGFSRGKANLDMELISRHSEGVIALTGCLQSRFCRRLVEDRPDDARAHIDDLIQVFGARAGLLRAPAQRHRRAGQGERGHRPRRQGGRPPAGRHRRRPLPASARTTTTTPRCSACRRSRRSPSRSCASTPTSSS